MTAIEILRSSRLIDVRFIEAQSRITNKYGIYWTMIGNQLIGVNDFRPRLGTFETPWGAPSLKEFAPPPFVEIKESLKDLLDQRALELLSIARTKNKKIAILWSGGIDSTAVLSSFIKNISPQEFSERIMVILSSSSIMENFNFYAKFISKKVKCMDYHNLDVTSEFLQQYILIHGDPADCLYGPSVPAYQQLLDSGQHHDSYKNHLDSMAAIVQPSTESRYHIEGFGKWWVNKVTENLEEVKPPGVESVSDWWWWHYYNFKWEFSCQRPFFFARKDFSRPIDQDLLDEFISCTYYNTPRFQNWSYSNLKRLVGRDRLSHKMDAKNYIFDLDQNKQYFESKIKVPSAPGNILWRMHTWLPVAFDKNWVGHYVWEDGLAETCFQLLQDYKG